MVGGVGGCSRATGGSLRASSALTIGSLGGGYYFNGSLQEVAGYGRALTAGRIQAHYWAGAAQLTATSSAGPGQFPNQALYSRNALADQPQGYWRLGEGAGSLAGDTSGYGNTGVISGGVSLDVVGAPTDGDGAARFDGPTGAITVANAAALDF